MKGLLVAINAKYIHSNLAVYSLKAAAGALGEDVELAEYTINHRTEDIFRSIYRKKPQLLFFSCYIWNRSMIVELAQELRKVLPESVIWAGGPEVSYDARSFLEENPQFDGVMCGEGERTFAQVLAYYERRECADEIGSASEVGGVAKSRMEAGSHEAACERSAAGTTEAACKGSAAGTAEAVCKNVEKARGTMEEANAEKAAEYGEPLALEKIAGLVYRVGNTIIETGAAQPLATLDELPFVYDRPFVKESGAVFENRIIYYESSRGCPFSCSYCLSSLDKRVRLRSLSLVKRELAYFLEQRVPQVKFVDRTFNCNHSHALAIWKFIAEHDNGVTNFHFEIAADLLNEEELAVLRAMRPGLVQLEIGVQTTNEEALRAIDRKNRFERIVERFLQIAEGKNIHQHLDLIAGLPYEDFESFKKSFDDVYRLKPQELQLGFLKVLRGSGMHRCAQEYGLLYRSEPPYEVLATRWISCEELLRLKEVEEMLEVYYNSQQFRYTMEALERLFDRPFAMYEALADYYERQSPQERSYSRMQRFEMLRGFICETLAERGATTERDVTAERSVIAEWERPEEKAQKIFVMQTQTEGRQVYEAQSYFDELLTFDLYLRENAKSRPAWARDQREYQRTAVAFYQREEEMHRYLPEYADRTWKQMMRMTHLERFSENTWMLFDYAQRDPLTGDARVRRIEEDMLQ